MPHFQKLIYNAKAALTIHESFSWSVVVTDNNIVGHLWGFSFPEAFWKRRKNY
jgi:hypothetical protein